MKMKRTQWKIIKNHKKNHYNRKKIQAMTNKMTKKLPRIKAKKIKKNKLKEHNKSRMLTYPSKTHWTGGYSTE